MNQNQKWHKFAQKIVEGVAQTDAYQKIYKCKKRKTAEQNASKLLENAKFNQVLQQYQDEVKEKHEGLAEETIKELRTLAFSDITEIADVDKELYVNLRADKLSELPSEVRRTIQSYDVQRTSGGTEENPFDKVTFKFKLHDKLGALNTLTKILGITKEDEDSRRAELEQMTKAELLFLIVKKLTELEDKYGNVIIPMKAITDGKRKGRK